MLGHATNDEIRAMVEGGIKFSDIFEVSDEPKEGYIEVYAGSNKKAEYLKVKNEKAAAFLETMRYAAYMGATTEFRKAEGLGPMIPNATAPSSPSRRSPRAC